MRESAANMQESRCDTRATGTLGKGEGKFGVGTRVRELQGLRPPNTPTPRFSPSTQLNIGHFVDERLNSDPPNLKKVLRLS